MTRPTRRSLGVLPLVRVLAKSPMPGEPVLAALG